MDFFSIQSHAKRTKIFLLMAAAPVTMASIFLVYLALSICLSLALYRGHFNVFNVNEAFSTTSINREATADGNSFDWHAYFMELKNVVELSASSLPKSIYGTPPALLALRPLLIIGGGLAIIFLLIFEFRGRGVRRSGGEYVARLMGAIAIQSPTNAPEKRFLNAIEEIAVASGLPVPTIYLLPRERVINSMTAGTSPQDAIIIITQGALDSLPIEELKALAAHEFARILNSDFAINHYIDCWNDALDVLSVVSGVIWLYLIVIIVLSIPEIVFTGETPSVPGTTAIALLSSLAVWGGKLPQALVQAALRRNNDNLADAFAAQFTRNPKAFASVLKKIGGGRNTRPGQNLLTLSASQYFMVDPVNLYQPQALSGNKKMPWMFRTWIRLEPTVPYDPLVLQKNQNLSWYARLKTSFCILLFYLTGAPKIGRFRQSLERRIRNLEPDWDGIFIDVPSISDEDEYQIDIIQKKRARKEAELRIKTGDDFRLFRKSKKEDLDRTSTLTQMANRFRFLHQSWVGLLLASMAFKGSYDATLNETANDIFIRYTGVELCDFVRFLPQWPDDIRAAAMRPDQVGSLIFAAVMNAEPNNRERQMAIITANLGQQASLRAAGLKVLLEPQHRLAVLDLAAPTVINLPAPDRLKIGEIVSQMTAIDEQLDLFKIAALMRLQNMGIFHLNPQLDPSPGSLDEIRRGVSKILSYLAQLGNEDDNVATRSAKNSLIFFKQWFASLDYDPPNGLNEIVSSLEQLKRAPLELRKALLLATVSICLDGGQIKSDEYHLAYAVAAALNVRPVQPLDPREPLVSERPVTPPLFDNIELLISSGVWRFLQNVYKISFFISFMALLAASYLEYSRKWPALALLICFAFFGLMKYIYPGAADEILET